MEKLYQRVTFFQNKQSSAAFLIVLSTIIIALISFLIFFHTQTNTLSRFTPEHVSSLGMVENSNVRRAFLLSIVSLLAASFFLKSSLIEGEFRLINTILCWASAAVLGGFIFYAVWDIFFPLSQASSVGLTGILSCLIALLLILTSHLHQTRWCRASFLIATILVLGAIVYPGLAQVPQVPAQLLKNTEWHYSSTLAQADRLAYGFTLGKEINLNYGLLNTALIAALQQKVGFLDLTSKMRLVQMYQVVFLVLGCLSCLLWSRSNYLFALFSLAFWGFWAGTDHVAILHPNQTGWRSACLPISLLALWLCRKIDNRLAQAAFLGFMAQACILYNPETGLCIALGFAAFLWAADESNKLAVVISYFAGIACAILTATALFFLLFGRFAPFADVFGLNLITRFSGGYGSMPLQFDIMAALIWIHAMYVFSQNILKKRQEGRLAFEDKARLCIATIILFWFAYYVNRPDFWNLWTYKFLYVFLISNWFTPLFFQQLKLDGWRAVLNPRLAVLIALLIPNALFPEATAHRPLSHQGQTANFQQQKKMAGYLMHQEPSTIFLTEHSYSVPLLAGRFTPINTNDAYAETITNQGFLLLFEDIYRQNAPIILLDEKNSTKEYRSFYDRLRKKLSPVYYKAGNAAGWEVWHRRSNSK